MAANLTRAVAAHVTDGLKKAYTAELQQRPEVCSVCELQKHSCGGWQIVSIPRQFRSLPEKFNAIARGWRKATFWSSGRTTTSTCHTTSARTCQRWKGGYGRSHRSC